jgi:hypothetical protein
VAGSSLEGVRAKLGRADEHLNALQAELRAFEEREPYAVSRQASTDEEWKAEDGWQAVRFHEREPPPLRIGLILGDFFYNLRSALDHLAWQLVLLDGGTPGDHTAFPVTVNPAKWDSAGGGTLKGASPEHKRAIQRLQPYPTANSPLNRAIEAVNTHCNRDKHKTLHPVFAVFSTDPNQVVFRRKPLLAAYVEVAYTPEWQRLEDDAVFAYVRVTTPVEQPKMEMEIEFPVGVAFGETGLVPKALPEIRMLIGRVVEQFAPDFR